MEAGRSLPKAMEPRLSFFLLHHAVRPPLSCLAPKAGPIINKTPDEGCIHSLCSVACWETLALPLALLTWWTYNWLLGSSVEICPALSMAGDSHSKLEVAGSLRTYHSLGGGVPQVFTHPLCVLLYVMASKGKKYV